jgi:hypothetical protein
VRQTCLVLSCAVKINGRFLCGICAVNFQTGTIACTPPACTRSSADDAIVAVSQSPSLKKLWIGQLKFSFQRKGTFVSSLLKCFTLRTFQRDRAIGCFGQMKFSGPPFQAWAWCRKRSGPNATKWFAAIEIIRFAVDQDWLPKATKDVAKYWRSKRKLVNLPSVRRRLPSIRRDCWKRN